MTGRTNVAVMPYRFPAEPSRSAAPGAASRFGGRFFDGACLECETARHECAVGQVGSRAHVVKRRVVVAVDQCSTAVDEGSLIRGSYQPPEQ